MNGFGRPLLSLGLGSRAVDEMDLYGGIEDTPAAPDVNNTNNSINMSLNASQELYDPENPNSDDEEEGLVIDDKKPEEIPLPPEDPNSIPLPEGNKPQKIKIQIKSTNKILSSPLNRNTLKKAPKVEVASPKKKALLAEIFGDEEENKMAPMAPIAPQEEKEQEKEEAEEDEGDADLVEEFLNESLSKVETKEEIPEALPIVIEDDDDIVEKNDKDLQKTDEKVSATEEKKGRKSR